jgi:SAM-dependent methyltransferase
MIGANHSTPILELTIFSMPIISFPVSQRGLFITSPLPKEKRDPYNFCDLMFCCFPGHRCNLVAVIAEVDRILRPEGNLIVRDNVEIIGEIESLAKSLNWDIRMIYSKDNEGLLCVHKTMWRPTEPETITSAIR